MQQQEPYWQQLVSLYSMHFDHHKFTINNQFAFKTFFHLQETQHCTKFHYVSCPEYNMKRLTNILQMFFSYYTLKERSFNINKLDPSDKNGE